MPTTAPIEAYLRFMKWFSRQYPDLHRRYWQYISPSANGGEVIIDGTDLDAVTFANLVQLQYDFYHPDEESSFSFLS